MLVSRGLLFGYLGELIFRFLGYKDLERCWQVLQEKHDAYAAAVDCENEDMVKENNY